MKTSSCEMLGTSLLPSADIWDRSIAVPIRYCRGFDFRQRKISATSFLGFTLVTGTSPRKIKFLNHELHEYPTPRNLVKQTCSRRARIFRT